ncbi:hypothetical protein [Halalkalibacter alkalisediminis]|uniref:Uncharacterized protein n=1 Tax=Halalkalibacter alkalisediminis TaxID=935616 RepID=A0ABV6NJG4_9BACI|nr:hypothetical protein [Halalkalibacter alkalisediminis]
MRKKVPFIALLLVCLFIMGACFDRQNQDVIDTGMASASSEYEQGEESTHLEYEYVEEEAVLAKEGGAPKPEHETIWEDGKEKVAFVEERMVEIKEAIMNEEYEKGKEELLKLRDEIDHDDIMIIYQLDVTDLLEQVELALEEDHGESEPGEQDEPTEAVEVVYLDYVNERFGFSFKYPEGLESDPPPENRDGVRFYNDDFEIAAYGGNHSESIEYYYEEAVAGVSSEVAYQRMTEDWYVLSYVENEMNVYKRFFYGESTFAGFVIMYPVDKQDTYDAVTAFISESFDSGVE